MTFPQDAIVPAAFLFELANGNSLGDFELSEIEACGLRGADPDVVSRGLQNAILHDHPVHSEYRQEAYWALGKRFDPAMLSFFRSALRQELTEDMKAAYQIMIALKNLNEDIFSQSRSCYAIDELELNRIDAEGYLNLLEGTF